MSHDLPSVSRQPRNVGGELSPKAWEAEELMVQIPVRGQKRMRRGAPAHVDGHTEKGTNSSFLRFLSPSGLHQIE